LPVGDNPQPLLYVSQGYRDINRTSNGFPAELKSAERFFDVFKSAAGGFTATDNKSGLTSMSFAVPNVTGQSATVPVSCYIRLKYLKQQFVTSTNPTNPTVIESANYLDNLIYPLDLRIPFSGPANIKSFVYDEEIYVNAQTVAGLNFDFIGKVGIARDKDNTTFFLIPTDVRTKSVQASTFIVLSGETSDSKNNYPNFVALKYPLERIVQTDIKVSATASVPVAEFVSDAGQAKFVVPDFRKLLMIVIANATYDSWVGKISTGGILDGRFRTYLGITNLQEQPDIFGNHYILFELFLRGFALDGSGTNYEIREIGTEPNNNAVNTTVYVNAST